MEVAGKQSKQAAGLKPSAPIAARAVQAVVRGTAMLALLTLFSAPALALGLGELTTKSALGQPMLAYIDLVGANGDAENRCFKAVLNTLDGNRLGAVTFSVHSTDTAAQLYLSTREAINEPAIVLTVEFVCSSQTRRDYQILLDLENPSASLPVVAASNPVRNALPAVAPGTGVATNSASAGDSGAAAKRSRRHHAATELPAGADGAPAKPAQQPPQQSAKEKKQARNAAKAFRNVLKLGSDSSVDDNLNGVEGMHLALSHGLRGENADLDAKAAPAGAAALPAPITAPGAPAAAAPGTQPAADAGANASPANAPSANAPSANAPPANDIALKELQEKIVRLQAQTEELQKLNAKQMADLEAARKAKESEGSLIYLYFLLFASFVAIAWLLWRTRQIQAGINHSWEEIVPEAEPKSSRQHFELDDEDDFLDHPVVKPKPEIRAHVPTGADATADELAEVPAAPAPRKDDFLATLAMPKVGAQEQAEGEYKFTGNVRTSLPDAEEILDEIQQAEFWMDMQQPQRAIEILESNWGSERPSSPLPWLYLFDLYRMVGDKDKYQELTERFERIFNGKVIAWDDGEMLQHSRSLEDFPVLLKKITQLWDSEELVPFMENLLIDDRDGRRQGFDLAAYRDILFLTNIAYEIQDTGAPPELQINAPDWSVIR